MAPVRTCIGCRRIAPADELVRVVRTPDGGLAVGRGLPGRGAWLCARSPACIETASRHKAFGRALRGHVSTEAIDALRAQVAERARMVGHRDVGT
ncbi:MAG: YlxR family protein [Actinobacteria bacterium]|nr:YlxR family protein [Actinomycetota bacterium]